MRVTETIVVASTEIRTNLRELTVSELSAELKRTVEENFSYVRLRGEILNYRGPHSSGHVYFCLKDAGARIDAIIWKGEFLAPQIQAGEGLEVVVTGKVTTYPGKSTYQIVIDSLEPAGAGALMALLEERKKKLKAEGLFDEARKKPLPYLPRVIGVVTSPTGAVIRDILHRLTDRFPRQVLVWPVRVQGETCAAEVAAAIEGFNALEAGGAVPRPDVLIVARGGGSLEDLWGFNEEIVVRVAAASAIPLVSAVGHETDTTLIDHAADRRAPTPTAAAEMAVPVRLDLVAELSGKGQRLAAALARHFGECRLHLAGLARGLPEPRDLIGIAAQRLDDRVERLGLAIAGRLSAARQRLAAARLRPEALAAELGHARARLGDLAPRLAAACGRTLAARRDALDNFTGRLASHVTGHENVLKRGYVVVRAGRHIVTAAAEIGPGADLDLEFHDGRVNVTAGGRKRRKPAAPEAQGRLL